MLFRSDIRPPEIEIELEKEIEIEKEREGETGHPAPAAYGRYNNVILTDTELSGLKMILCQEKVQIKNDFFPSCQHT